MFTPSASFHLEGVVLLLLSLSHSLLLIYKFVKLGDDAMHEHVPWDIFSSANDLTCGLYAGQCYPALNAVRRDNHFAESHHPRPTRPEFYMYIAWFTSL